MANSAKKELRSYVATERKENAKLGLKFAGFGAASLWVYPLVILTMFAINAFTLGLPENAKNNEELGYEGVSNIVKDSELTETLYNVISKIPSPLQGELIKLSETGYGFIMFYLASLLPIIVFAIIGIFRVRGRWWAIAGAAVGILFNPYLVMVILMPVVTGIPAFFDGITKSLFGG